MERKQYLEIAKAHGLVCFKGHPYRAETFRMMGNPNDEKNDRFFVVQSGVSVIHTLFFRRKSNLGVRRVSV